MLYQSTRGGCTAEDTRAVLMGIAPDGGLFVDPHLAERDFDWEACLALKPLDMAAIILRCLLPGFEDMDNLVKNAYADKFESEDLTPLIPVGDDYILELFHGPTSAFKDVALSMLPQLISAARRQEGEPGLTAILTATSGDTGKAALEGFHDVEGCRILVFYPADGVSEVQKQQMVTQPGRNVTVCAVRGNFDDCQQGVKQAFAAIEGQGLLRASGVRLSSANSINIGRLAPQLVYYFIAYAKLLRAGRIQKGERVDFVVPTGNFGDILAGYMAKKLGLPIGRLLCASNANRVLTDFFETGVYDRRRAFVKTESPSMDILISSNLERLLFFASGGDTGMVSECMRRLNRDGYYRAPDWLMDEIRRDFTADSCPEEETMRTIGRVWRDRAYLCDPHTAVAMYAAERYKRTRGEGAPLVVLSTASPYKFPGAVLRAIGAEDKGEGGLTQMRRLERLTAVPIPHNLAMLPDLPVRHRDIIERDELLPYILKTLREEM